MKQDIIKNYKNGYKAEIQAASYLTDLGHHVLVSRCRTKYGEIDLITLINNTVAFVEVKRRKLTSDAIQAVNYIKQARLIKSAVCWMDANPRYYEQYCFKFDVITINHSGVINYLPAAYVPGDDEWWS